MDTRIITAVNQKGGVGKSTTALALTAGLHSLKGYKVLSIDLDAQANFTFSSGATITEGLTVLEILTGKVTPQQVIQHTSIGDVIPACLDLAGADALFTGTGREYRLKEALKDVVGQYDYIIIDTPPALGILTVNALTVADSVIIPAQADIYSLQGAEQLTETIERVRKYCNSALTVDGILLTRYNPRSTLSKDLATLTEQLAQKVGTRVYKSKIREAVTVKEAQIDKESIYEHAPSSSVAWDYKDFVEEFLTTQENKEQNG